MKALLVLVIVLLGAASAFAYGHADVASGLSSVVEQTTEVVLTEPVMLLLSGALLLVLGGAVRRLPV
jgi:phosphate/sulfate permease